MIRRIVLGDKAVEVARELLGEGQRSRKPMTSLRSLSTVCGWFRHHGC
jgi:hypothetical protein